MSSEGEKLKDDLWEAAVHGRKSAFWPSCKFGIPGCAQWNDCLALGDKF